MTGDGKSGPGIVVALLSPCWCFCGANWATDVNDGDNCCAVGLEDDGCVDDKEGEGVVLLLLRHKMDCNKSSATGSVDEMVVGLSTGFDTGGFCNCFTNNSSSSCKSSSRSCVFLMILLFRFKSFSSLTLFGHPSHCDGTREVTDCGVSTMDRRNTRCNSSSSW